MTPTRHSLVAGLLTGLLLVSLAGSPAVAQDDDDLVDISAADATDDASLFEQLQALGGLFMGGLGGVGDSISQRVASATGDVPAAEQEAADLAAFVNGHNDSLVDHTNQVLDEYNGTVADTTYVLKVTVEGEDADATRWFVATGDGEDITDTWATATKPAETVDRTAELSVWEAEDLNADLREYRREYVAEDEVPPLGYYTRVGSQYVDVSEIEGDS